MIAEPNNGRNDTMPRAVLLHNGWLAARMGSRRHQLQLMWRPTPRHRHLCMEQKIEYGLSNYSKAHLV